MYAYLIGVLGLGLIFTYLCLVRKDLRSVVLYSGLLYLLYGFIIFIFIKLLTHDPTRAISPGYWTPPSLLNLNARTGGYGIEDAIFSIFAGGIAAGLYELVFKLRVSKKTSKKLKKGHALSIALIAGSAIFLLTSLNAIYFFVFLQTIGGIGIVWQRRDLLLHALVGGLFFMFFYGALFLVFNFLFPSFITDYYHLQNTSHHFILGVPVEEFLYALTLGFMWAPIYEYEHKLRDSAGTRLRKN